MEVLKEVEIDNFVLVFVKQPVPKSTKLTDDLYDTVANLLLNEAN